MLKFSLNVAICPSITSVGASEPVAKVTRLSCAGMVNSCVRFFAKSSGREADDCGVRVIVKISSFSGVSE